ncbi:hypothetical protein COU61_04375 [Candidatus Pacearchaeota archaeon CG10_big_fil_rev_8_21_14_0_10_35_13]|nr:MAG: hypothetical protein COU61_04375 [Candidatus Pacearchaeota archaeon CG10_big_fil_rev_8_21_14_0_10_35_13]
MEQRYNTGTHRGYEWNVNPKGVKSEEIPYRRVSKGEGSDIRNPEEGAIKGIREALENLVIDNYERLYDAGRKIVLKPTIDSREIDWQTRIPLEVYNPDKTLRNKAQVVTDFNKRGRCLRVYVMTDEPKEPGHPQELMSLLKSYVGEYLGSLGQAREVVSD